MSRRRRAPGAKKTSSAIAAGKKFGGTQPVKVAKKSGGAPRILRGKKVSGKIQGSGKGFAFFVPSDGSGDMFIAANNLHGAMHGDSVDVVKISDRRGNGECAVVDVTSRGYSQVVGVYDGHNVVSSLRGFGEVPVTGETTAKVGDKVVGDLVENSRPLCCRIVEVLGKTGDLGVEVMAVIRAHNLREDFPKSVLRETAAAPDSVTEDDIRGRRDFRSERIVTIDGSTSKDFDDAITVKKTKNGYSLGVHIADVAHYVTESSQIDNEAITRGTSVYFADRVLPMLPEKLSNGICSLNEGEDRLTLSCLMDFDSEGNLTRGEVVEGVIRSKARMTYDSVARIYDGDKAEREKYADFLPMLESAKELALLLNARRMARGSVEFEIDECEIVMDGDRVVDVRRRPRLFSHKLIEEFMLAANETVARKFSAQKIPFVYRVHETPPAEKVESLNAFLGSLGLSVPDRPTPKDYAALIAALDESVRGAVSRVALRSMSKAEYKTECLGHFGLAAEYYCHFTSPIRRYPDLAIHRIIKHCIKGESVKRYAQFAAEAARAGSEREKIADEAERKVDDLLKARFMIDKIGECYDAHISGVTDWGLFCELASGVEGMVRVESLAGGGYVFDPKLMLVTNGAKTYRLGGAVKIRVEAVNFDKVAFALVDEN